MILGVFAACTRSTQRGVGAAKHVRSGRVANSNLLPPATQTLTSVPGPSLHSRPAVGARRGRLLRVLGPRAAGWGWDPQLQSPGSMRVSRFTHRENGGGLASRGELASETVLWEDTDGFPWTKDTSGLGVRGLVAST